MSKTDEHEIVDGSGMRKIELIETTADDRGLNAGRPATNPVPRHCNVFDDDQFMHEATPPDITDDIVSLCKERKAEHPLYVEVRPAEGARQGRCFRNVLDHASKHGGGPPVWLDRMGRSRLVLECRVSLRVDAAAWRIARHHAESRRRARRPLRTRPDVFRRIRLLPAAEQPAHPRIRHGGEEGSRRGQDPRPERGQLGLRDAESRQEGSDVDAVDLLEAAPGSLRDSDRHLPAERRRARSDAVPTNEGLVCRDLNRWEEFQKRARELNRMKLKLYTMADLMVRGISRFG